MLTIDFETSAIQGNPIYNPPQPVGVAIKEDSGESHYLCWGHPCENNSTFEAARRTLLGKLEAHHHEWLAHNAAFESAVLRKYFGYVPADSLQVNDTQFLIFLADPYAFSFSLKPSAERILNLPPTEQDDLRAWVIANVACRPSEWAAHISKAPGDLVGLYARGDVDRTWLLYQELYPRILQMGMLDPYRREQKLLPILSEASRRGVRLDAKALADDLPMYEAAQRQAEEYIHGVLGEFNIDSDSELADALDRRSLVTEWVYTTGGKSGKPKRSTSRKNLEGRIRDPRLLDYLAYRGVLATCLGTFARPWLAQAAAEGGRLHPQWNQIRGNAGEGGDPTGTRTGRMSCKEPNFQNVPNDFEKLVVPPGLPPPPHMRQYLLPEQGHVWLKRDFAAQEMRIMSHYAEGKLFNAFRTDPRTDPHTWVSDALRDRGFALDRKQVKIVSFSLLYGSGIPKLSAQLGTDEEQAREFRNAYMQLLPEIRALSDDTRNRGKRGGYIRTWGGRVYYREPDATRDFSYKLLNYLVQGSAADQTKQALIDYDKAKGRDDLLLAAVHDEVNASVPLEREAEGMSLLREAMNKERFDVPFRSDGFRGANWSDLTACN